jgi:hypothetical protein
VPKYEIAIISAPRVSSSEVARQWLVKFATVCQKDFSPALANIWDEQLRDIEPDVLNRACDAVMKKWDTGFLPVPGNIRREAEALRVSASLMLETTNRREEARLLTERAVAYAEHKRQHQLPPPKIEAPIPQRHVEKSPIVDFEGRKKDLARQAEEIRKKYPPTGTEAAD